VAFLSLAIAAAPVTAAAPPSIPPPQAASPPLAGPRAIAPAPSATLVVYDFTGRLRRPDIPPEAAAAALLALDDHARAAVEAALARRAAILDAFVRENLDLLTQIGTAGATGDKLDQLGLAQLAYTKLQPLRSQGTLQEVIRAALPTDAAARFDAALDEYWRAVVREGQREPGENGNPRHGVQAVIEERLRTLGREIELSFERQLRSGDILFSYLTAGLQLRPEQAVRIRQAVADVVERTDVESDKRAQALLGASILAYLDPQQAAAFILKVKKLSE
jgi:hypothetical protein